MAGATIKILLQRGGIELNPGQWCCQWRVPTNQNSHLSTTTKVAKAQQVTKTQVTKAAKLRSSAFCSSTVTAWGKNMKTFLTSCARMASKLPHCKKLFWTRTTPCAIHRTTHWLPKIDQRKEAKVAAYASLYTTRCITEFWNWNVQIQTITSGRLNPSKRCTKLKKPSKELSPKQRAGTSHKAASRQNSPTLSPNTQN